MLLRAVGERAELRGWHVVHLEGRRGESGERAIRKDLARQLAAIGQSIDPKRAVTDRLKAALGTVKSFSLNVGFASIDLGVEPLAGRRDSGEIEIGLPDVLRALAVAIKDEEGGLLIAIDEMHDLDSELLFALVISQLHRGASAPLLRVGAGLDRVSRMVAHTRSDSERAFDFTAMRSLRDPGDRLAITVPSERNGVHATDTA